MQFGARWTDVAGEQIFTKYLTIHRNEKIKVG